MDKNKKILSEEEIKIKKEKHRLTQKKYRDKKLLCDEERLKRNEYSRNYYKKNKVIKEKPIISEEEKRQKRLDYCKKYRKEHYVYKRGPYQKLTDEEKRLKKNESAKKYYEKIKKTEKPKSNFDRKEYNKKYYEKKKQLLTQNKAIKEHNYIYDDKLYYEIIISLGKGKLTKKAENILIKIVDKLIVKFSYNGDINKDLAQDAKLNLLINWKNFNPDRYNKALPYFTELAKRSIAGHYKLLKNKSKYHKGMISLTAFI